MRKPLKNNRFTSLPTTLSKLPQFNVKADKFSQFYILVTKTISKLCYVIVMQRNPFLVETDVVRTMTYVAFIRRFNQICSET